MLVWMHDHPLREGRGYRIKIGTQSVPGEVVKVRYRVAVNTLKKTDGHDIDGRPGLRLNEVGRLLIETTRPVIFDPYRKNRATGSFVLIDRMTNVTVGAGMILDRKASELVQTRRSKAKKRAGLLDAQSGAVTTTDRAQRYGHAPGTVWLTGLPRSGKSTIAYALEARLWALGCATHVLDGVNMRLGLSRDLGFTADERSEASRRAAETARLFNDAGLLTVAAFVSPYESDRERAQTTVGEDRFVEVWLKAPVSVCEARDAALYPKGDGLYARARRGEVKHFTGLTAPYEEPSAPDLVVETDTVEVDAAVDQIISILRTRGVLPAID
jgi:bifunctional enzyme CysN/CysC